MYNGKTLLILSVFLFFIVVFVAQSIESFKITKNNVADLKRQQVQQQFDNYLNMSEELSLLTKSVIFNDESFWHHISEAQRPEARELTRTVMYEKYLHFYETLKPRGVRQLHIHLPGGISFLRFHKPDKYGDSLINIRPTIKYVNEHLHPINGYEEGRVLGGYRYVYPIIRNDVFYGSIEISFSTDIPTYKLGLHSESTYEIIYRTENIQKAVWYDYQNTNYYPCVYFEGYSHIKSESSHIDGIDIKTKLSVKEKMNGVDKRDLKDLYTLVKADGKNYISIYVPIYGAITGEIAGYIWVLEHSVLIDEHESRLIIDITFSLLLLFIIIILLYLDKRENENKRILLQEANETDYLTDTKNRMIAEKTIEQKLSDIDNSTGSVVLIDIAAFKEINSIYGNVAGDNVLKSLSSIIKNNIDNDDLVSRWSGDKFLVIINKNILESKKIVENIISSVDNIKPKDHPKYDIYAVMTDINLHECLYNVIKKLDKLRHQSIYEECLNKVIF